MFLGFAKFLFPTLEVIRESAVNSVVMAQGSMVHLMVVHVVLASGGAIIHHQIILLLSPVPLYPILRITMLHHQDASSSCWCIVVGKVWRLLVHHRWRHKSAPVTSYGGISHAQVAAAAVDAAVHAPLLRTTVVVTDAFGRGAPQLVELFEVFSQGGISQVTRWCTSESAELVVRRLKARMEEGRVKVISVVMKMQEHRHSSIILTTSNNYSVF